MDRLTFYDNMEKCWRVVDDAEVRDGLPTKGEYVEQNVIDRLAAYEDTGLEPEEITEYLNATDEYVEASEEGRLIVRPGTVYQTDGVDIYESTVRKVIYDTGHFAFDEDAIGHSVWLTREEAEAALGGDHDA